MTLKKMEIRLEMIVYVGSRNKCSTEMSVKNSDNNDNNNKESNKSYYD